jgi:hypothetical protein
MPLAAVAGVSSFAAIVVLLQLVQRGAYHPLADAVSVLALGRDGGLMAVAFCALALGALAAAAALKRTSARPSLAPKLLAASGLLTFVSAFVHADPPSAPTSTHGLVHQLAGVVTFVLLIAGMFSAVRPFRRDPEWRWLATPTLAWAAVAVAALLSVSVVGGADFGLAQRCFLAACLSWVLTVAVSAARLGGHEAGEPAQERAAAGLRAAGAPVLRQRDPQREGGLDHQD